MIMHFDFGMENDPNHNALIPMLCWVKVVANLMMISLILGLRALLPEGRRPIPNLQRPIPLSPQSPSSSCECVTLYC